MKIIDAFNLSMWISSCLHEILASLFEVASSAPTYFPVFIRRSDFGDTTSGVITRLAMVKRASKSTNMAVKGFFSLAKLQVLLAVALFVFVVRTRADIALSDSDGVSVGDLTAGQIEDRLQVRQAVDSFIRAYKLWLS